MPERKGPDIIRAEVLAEIEGWKLKPPEGDTWHSYLANFDAYLPNDKYKGRGERFKGYFALIGDCMDTQNDEIYKSEEGRKLHSQLFLSQTPREFFQEIDRTIGELDGVISTSGIKRFQGKLDKLNEIRFSQKMSPKEEQIERMKILTRMMILRQLLEYALPLYVELRVKGYSHYDLTS